MSTASRDGRPAARVWGVVRLPEGTATSDFRVVVYDVDMASETALDSGPLDAEGAYDIRYHAEWYAADEAGTADLRVRVIDAAKNVCAESDVYFNAPNDLRIDVTLDASALVSEWERSVAAIDLVRQQVPIDQLTDKHLDFLSKELSIALQRLRMIRTAVQRAPGLVTTSEVLYALQRMDLGATAEELGRHDRPTIVEAITRAVHGRIVPRIDPSAIERLLTRLSLAKADRQPLPEAIVDAGGRGAATFVKKLVGKGVRSLGDLRSPAGYKAFVEATADEPADAVNHVRSHVNLSVLAPEPRVRAALIEGGFGGINDIASAPLDEFLGATARSVDPLAATTLHTQAVLLQSFIKKSILEVRLEHTRAGSHGTPRRNVLDEAVEAGEHACDCADCESAVSPLAYLADLLTYCYDNLRDSARSTGQQRVDYLRLTRELHQRFGDLPSRCGAIEEQVRQVRIAVEVLRSHLAAHPASSQAAAALATAEREYLRQTYELLLLRIGTSYADVRLGAVAPAAEAADLALAIGMRAPQGGTNHVRDLLLDVSGPLATFESQIERRFGLKSTRTDPLVAVPTPDLAIWRRERLRDIWLEQDWPSDTPGTGILLIDPDLIGPDDLRNPDVSQPRGAFEIWVRRRGWVDAQLTALLAITPAANASRLEAMLNAMFVTTGTGALPVYPLRGGAASPARAWPANLTQLLAIVDTLASGTKAGVTAAIATLASSYGLTVDGFQRLLILREKDLASLGTTASASPPTPAEIREFASILGRARTRLHAQDWAAEEQTAQSSTDPNVVFEFGPLSFWIALTEHDPGEWPPPDDGVTPWIDPELIRRTELPDSAIGDVARQRWDTRLQELQTAKGQIATARRTRFDDTFPIAFGTLPTGLPAALTSWTEFVDDTLQLLGSGVPADLATGRQRLDTVMFLSEDNFRRLLSIRARDASTDPADTPTTAELDEADTLLVGAWKRRTRYGTTAATSWYTNERTGGTALASWQALKMRLDPWRAAPEDRLAWQSALRLRSKPPLIDPDVFDARYLRLTPASMTGTPTTPPQIAARLWQTRQTDLSAKQTAIRTAREAASTTADQGLVAAIAAAASPALFTRANLQQLRTQSAAGASIARRLDQLGFSPEAFAFISRIDEIVAAGQPVAGTEWTQVYDILVQFWKRGIVVAWRTAERQANVTLGPDCFQIPAVDVTAFPPPLRPDLPAWRASDEQRQSWEERLQARTDQDAEVDAALATAIGAVESVTLTQLRDALIAAVPLSSLPAGSQQTTPSQKPKVLARQLLIDLEMSGCAVTTRVAQAIDTIQDLLFSLRSGFLDAYPTWSLTTSARDSFDAVWQFLGTYASWRAAMFVLLYPENLLVPTLRRERTWAFSMFLRELRNAGTLAGADARAATDGFVSYLRDIAELAITPSPAVDSRFIDEGQSVPVALAPAGRISVRILLGLAPTSRQVYWSVVYQGRQGEIQTAWRPLSSFKRDVASIVGATTYRTPDGRRYLYVFATTNRDGEDHVDFARFDLESEGRWSPAEAESLDLSGQTHLASVTLLNTPEDIPPAVRVATRAGAVMDFQLGVKGTTSNVTVASAGTPTTWSTVYRPPQLAPVPGIGTYRAFGGLALRTGSFNTRYDLVYFALIDGLTTADWIFGGVRVIRGIGPDGAPPTGNQGGFEPVGDRRPAPSEHLPVTAWAFGNASQASKPVSCAIAVGDVDGDQKDDLVMIYLVRDTNVSNPAQLYCRLGGGLNDDGTADRWINSNAAMLSGLPGNPGACAATILRRTTGGFDLLVAGSGGAQGNTIWLRAVTVQVQTAGLTFSNVRTGPTMTAGGKVGGLGIALADLDGDGVGDLIVQWTEQDTNGNQTASKLSYGPKVDANGFPTQSWQTPQDVLPAFYQGGSATWTPGASALAAGSFSGAPGRVDALIASFPKPGSDEWRYILANNINLQLSPSSGQVLNAVRYKPFLAPPLVPASYDFRVGAARTYAPSLTQVWSRNLSKTRINQVLVEEAYYFVPLAIALQLQQSMNFLASLDWFRATYDYTLPASARVLYPGLEPTPGGSAVYRDGNWKWLQDPLDPHGIAQGRAGTFKLFTLQAVGRCILDYADSQFAFDTAESITLARTLYLEALDLFNDSELQQTYNGCEAVREWITFTIGDLASTTSQSTLDDLFEILKTRDGRILSTAAAALGEAHRTGTMTTGVANQLHAIAGTVAAAPAAPATLGEVLLSSAERERGLTQAFLSEAEYAPSTITLLSGTSDAVSRLFTESFGTPYGDGMFETPVDEYQIAEGLTYARIPGGGYTDPVGGGGGGLPGGGTLGGFFGGFIGGLGSRVFDVVPFDPSIPPKGNSNTPGGFGYQPPKFTPAPEMFAIEACVPPNPVLRALRLRAELNLYKIRTCRSITGERRQVDPYSAPTDTTSGMPAIGSGGQLVLPGLANLAPTPYRFSVLVERARDLVQLAQQTESAMFAAIQAGDAERYSAFNAKQDLEAARANVKLQTLRVSEADSNIVLTELYRDRAQLQIQQYSEWLSGGVSDNEQVAVAAMWVAFGLYAGLAVTYATAAATASATGIGGILAFQFATSGVATTAQASQQLAQIYQFWQAYDEKRKGWMFQRNLAQQDRKIAEQQD